MPRRTTHYKDDATAVVYVRVPGWLKNDIVQLCKELDVSVNSWSANILYQALLERKNLPTAPEPAGPIPTIQDILRSYLTKEPVLEPCGREAPCERWSTEPTVVSGVAYCGHCGIRVE